MCFLPGMMQDMKQKCGSVQCCATYLKPVKYIWLIGGKSKLKLHPNVRLFIPCAYTVIVVHTPVYNNFCVEATYS